MPGHIRLSQACGSQGDNLDTQPRLTTPVRLLRTGPNTGQAVHTWCTPPTAA